MQTSFYIVHHIKVAEKKVVSPIHFSVVTRPPPCEESHRYFFRPLDEDAKQKANSGPKYPCTACCIGCCKDIDECQFCCYSLYRVRVPLSSRQM